jgi:hypothetical protein
MVVQMESLSLSPVEIIKVDNDDDVSCHSRALNKVNQILEVVIRNTLQLNKFTTIDEIFESLHMSIDLYTIENICEAMTENDGILIKYVNRSKVCYKLNGKICA